MAALGVFLDEDESLTCLACTLELLKKSEFPTLFWMINRVVETDVEICHECKEPMDRRACEEAAIQLLKEFGNGQR